MTFSGTNLSNCPFAVPKVVYRTNMISSPVVLSTDGIVLCMESRMHFANFDCLHWNDTIKITSYSTKILHWNDTIKITSYSTKILHWNDTIKITSYSTKIQLVIHSRFRTHC